MRKGNSGQAGKKEAELQSMILSDLEYRGVLVFKIIKANEDGIPDIFFCSEKTGSVFIEMKREIGGVYSYSQKRFRRRIKEIGGARCYGIHLISEWIELRSMLF